MKRISIYLKLRVVGAIETMAGATLTERIREVAKLIFHDEDGVPQQFTWRTIQTWHYVHKNGGATALGTRPRSDKGKRRKVSPEHLREAIEQVLPDFREGSVNKMMVYRRCIERGLISPLECSQTSFYRLVREYELLKPASQTGNKRRLAFSKACANEMWQIDTMFGPHIKKNGTAVQTKLIAFIDDASRIVPHGEFFFAENTASLVSALRSALYKRGVPQTIYADNGSIYTCAELNQICARVGAILCHAPVRDGAAKGKIERFFRTVRMQFLVRNLDLSSLSALNGQFRDWVEGEYNTAVHSTLKMKPVDRFAMDLDRIRFLNPMEANDELFYFEEERTVRKDNTFQLKNVRYEAPRRLPARKIQVRFDRSAPSRVIVYYKGERMGEAREVDFLANDRPPPAATDRNETNNNQTGETQ